MEISKNDANKQYKVLIMGSWIVQNSEHELTFCARIELVVFVFDLTAVLISRQSSIISVMIMDLVVVSMPFCDYLSSYRLILSNTFSQFFGVLWCILLLPYLSCWHFNWIQTLPHLFSIYLTIYTSKLNEYLWWVTVSYDNNSSVTLNYIIGLLW